MRTSIMKMSLVLVFVVLSLSLNAAWTAYKPLYVVDDTLTCDYFWTVKVVGNNVWSGAYSWDSGLGGLIKFDGTNLNSPAAWTVYNTDNTANFPDNAVWAIEPQDDFLWVGTRSGLVKFVNNAVDTVYTETNSGIPSNYVSCIAIDSDNNVWVGTFLGGLAKFNPTNSTWEVFNTTNSNIPSNTINCLYHDGTTMWIGTTYGGMAKYPSGDTNEFKIYDLSNSGINSAHINGITKNTNGALIICTVGGGIVRYTEQYEMWETFTYANTTDDPDGTLPSNNSFAGAVTDNVSGVIWFATMTDNIRKFNNGDWKKEAPIKPIKPSAIALDASGRVWVTQAQDSLGIFVYSATILDEDDHLQSVKSIVLNQNYPNPFNPSTTISFNLPERQHATLSIYNIKGQLVNTLRNSVLNKGQHQVVWNGKDSGNNNVGSGVYFYKLQTNTQNLTQKMILIK